MSGRNTRFHHGSKASGAPGARATGARGVEASWASCSSGTRFANIVRRSSRLALRASLRACVLSARSLGDYLRVAWQVLIGHRRRSPNIRYYSAERSIVVDADRPLPVQGDGEILGETPVRVQVVPDAVGVIVPSPSAPHKRPTVEGQLVGV